jgi:hypothetical protein
MSITNKHTKIHLLQKIDRIQMLGWIKNDIFFHRTFIWLQPPDFSMYSKQPGQALLVVASSARFFAYQN